MNFSVKRKAKQIENQKQALLNEQNELCLSKVLNTGACAEIIPNLVNF